MFESEGMYLTLHTAGGRNLHDDGDSGPQVSQVGDGLRATWTLREGESTGVALKSMGASCAAVGPVS